VPVVHLFTQFPALHRCDNGQQVPTQHSRGAAQPSTQPPLGSHTLQRKVEHPPLAYPAAVKVTQLQLEYGVGVSLSKTHAHQLVT
jgi:hypothetical protein